MPRELKATNSGVRGLSSPSRVDSCGSSGTQGPESDGVDVVPLPLPGRAPSELAVPAPDSGEQRWAGAPTALVDGDGTILLSYRARDGEGDRVVLARSEDGVAFLTIAELTAASLGVPMVERAALVSPGDGDGTGWRLYVSCAEKGTKAWWIGLLEAPSLDGLVAADLRRLELGRGRLDAIKDPIVHRTGDGGWEAWVCCHHLDIPGAEDRMCTLKASSRDGIAWDVATEPVLSGRPGEWDARGARVTCVLPDGRAYYDGRASAEENWFERSGIARLTGEGAGGAVLRAVDDGPVADVRYTEVVALPTGGHRLYYEARRPDGHHELRTELHH